jgi:hypothetical protein
MSMVPPMMTASPTNSVGSTGGVVMRSIVVYESMFGNTHAIADAIAAGIAEVGDVTIGSTGAVTFLNIAEADLLVVGGPTHVHGMTSTSSRRTAIQTAQEDPDLELDEDAGGPGLRQWFKELPRGEGRVGVAFDTRIGRSEILTGSAARGIARRLRRHGYSELVEPESFLLEGNGPVPDAEIERARSWGAAIAAEFETRV